jgi:hypothetical protein
MRNEALILFVLTCLGCNTQVKFYSVGNTTSLSANLELVGTDDYVWLLPIKAACVQGEPARLALGDNGMLVSDTESAQRIILDLRKMVVDQSKWVDEDHNTEVVDKLEKCFEASLAPMEHP